jgi:hypothetical protein
MLKTKIPIDRINRIYRIYRINGKKPRENERGQDV